MEHSHFVHLHTHSDYSLLDGACKIERLVNRAAEFRMPAVAITDHGNLFGAVEFYEKCVEKGIRPIIGCEIYVTRSSLEEKRKDEKLNHLVLLAADSTGYRNLLKLSTLGYLEGFYYKPRVGMDQLRDHSRGLIALSACLKGEVSSLILAGDHKGAVRTASEYKDIFGEENFFLELQDHGMEEQKEVIAGMSKVASATGIPMVATNDCHYIMKEHARAHDVLLCIQTGRDLDDPNRLRFSTDEAYFKSPEEMEETFGEFGDALRATVEIAERCSLELDLGKIHLPQFPLPEGFDNTDEYLEKLARDGMAIRFGDIPESAEERLEVELDAIRNLGYSGYFLIVHDFIAAAKKKGIAVGPGRGSAAASIVSYALGITELNPIEHKLLFERFLNPGRKTMPDIDVDFCYERRDEVIGYIREKYGSDSVAQIITFGTMAARAVVRDVGRVLRIPYAEVDRIAKLVPQGVNVTLADAKASSEFRTLVESDERYQELYDIAQVLEGLSRHASTHAAGILIAPGKLDEFTPLYKSSKGDVTTQYDGKSVERVGLLKVDILGLRTLTVIQDTLKMLGEKGVDLDFDSLPVDDEKTFEVLSSGQTVGVFQVESSGMRDLLLKLRPERFEDIVAVNALFRPGPLQSDMIDDYVQRKHGRQEIVYEHELLRPVLEETYGIILYQEQVMQIASELGGFSMSEADDLLYAMRKKVVEVMDDQREAFIDGADGRGVERPIAERCFNLMAFFAGYGFNKAHSAAYAVLTYRTAYLKAHHPKEFLAASLTSEMGDTDRVVSLISESKRLGIEVLPPDVNRSFADFRPVQEGIDFGLAAIKNVGRSAVKSIVEEREEGGKFDTIFGFCERVCGRLVNRRMLESLIASGAMDSLEGTRAQKTAALELAMKRADRIVSHRNAGQTSLFGGTPDETALELRLPEVEAWDRSEALANEKKLLGFYVSGHPLAKYERDISMLATVTCERIDSLKDDSNVVIAGVVTEATEKKSKRGNYTGFITVEDFTGSCELIAFSDIYARYKRLLKVDSLVVVTGRVSTKEEGSSKILINDVYSFETAWSSFFDSMTISLPTGGLDNERMEMLQDVLSNSKGRCKVFMEIKTSDGKLVRVHLKKNPVSPSSELISSLEDIVGGGSVAVRSRAGFGRH